MKGGGASMVANRKNCERCGHFLSRVDQGINDGHCQKCRLLISSGQKNFSKMKWRKRKMKKGTKAIIWISSIVVFLLLILPLLAGGFRSWIIPLYKWGFDIKAPQSVAAVDTSTTAAPAATSVPATIDSNVDTSGLVTEQAYIPHPRRYEETGIENTKTWKNIVVNDDEYLVVGGTSVNGTNDGVYRGYGPGTYTTITVTNGFISIVDDDWGDEEFDFRVDQAVEYGWARAHINRGVIPN